jgi:predicted anti-sigma-YlaC factor YlaD
MGRRVDDRLVRGHMAAMPSHDPVPGRRDSRRLEREHRAWLRYRRMMKWMALASVAAALLALLYLKLSGIHMGLHLVIATSAGVGLSVLLGTALMGLVFLSNSGGHDDEAAHGGQDR